MPLKTSLEPVSRLLRQGRVRQPERLHARLHDDRRPGARMRRPGRTHRLVLRPTSQGHLPEYDCRYNHYRYRSDMFGRFVHCTTAASILFDDRPMSN